MALKDQATELTRLIRAFEQEAAKFIDVRLSTVLIASGGPVPERQAERPNHAIMLWQYYGSIETEDEIGQMAADLQDSNLQWGMKGAQLTSFALIEGPRLPALCEDGATGWEHLRLKRGRDNQSSRAGRHLCTRTSTSTIC